MGSENSKQIQKKVFVYFPLDTFIECALAKERKQHLITIFSLVKKGSIDNFSFLSLNGRKILF